MGIMSLGCVGADRPALMQMDTGSGSLGWAKSRVRAAYVMPGWAGRTTSVL